MEKMQKNIVVQVLYNDFDVDLKTYIGIANISCNFGMKLAHCDIIIWNLGKVVKNPSTTSEPNYISKVMLHNQSFTYFDVLNINLTPRHTEHSNDNQNNLKKVTS